MYSPDQPRDERGRFAATGGLSALTHAILNHQGMTGPTGSEEGVTQLFDNDPDTAANLATELNFNTVRDADVDRARAEIIRLTQESLRARGFPAEFVVYRGGGTRDAPLSVTTDPMIAVEFARHHRPGSDPSRPLAQYRIGREDVLCDIGGLLRHGYGGEQELLVRGAELKHVRDLTAEGVTRALHREYNPDQHDPSRATTGHAESPAGR